MTVVFILSSINVFMSTIDHSLAPEVQNYRCFFSYKYLKGMGIEIGALNHPLPISPEANVKYVDRLPVEKLKKQYRELATETLVEVDLIDDGETLSNIANSSQDFVIANHFLEHCQDPIGTLKNLLRVLRTEGILYLAIPDKRFCFDLDRTVTSIDHLILDHEQGPAWSKYQHFEEWIKLVEKVTDPEEINRQVNALIKRDYSIHFHVWTPPDFLDFLLTIKQKFHLPFIIKATFENHGELITILEKNN